MPIPHRLVARAVTCLVWVTTCAAADLPKAGIGFRYDGSGVFPTDWNPPVKWNAGTKENLRWRIATANWGYGTPIEIGDQVVYMCEPGNEALVWPTLVCVRADTGAEVWRVAIDPLLTAPLSAGERASLTADWAKIHEIWRFAYAAAANLEKDHADPVKLKTIQDAFAARGLSLTGFKPGYGLLRQFRPEENADYKAIMKRLEKYGARLCTWQRFSSERVGVTLPTPVSDGEAIYTFDHYGTVARIDRQGKIAWIVASGQKAAISNGFGASPRLCGNLLLTYAGGQMIAWDKRTGKQVWSQGKTASAHAHGDYTSPIIMDLDGTTVVVGSRGEVVRASDGVVLNPRIGKVAYANFGYDDASDIISFTYYADNAKTTQYVRRLRLAGQTALVDELGSHEINMTHSSLIQDGRIYGNGQAIDIATQAIIRPGSTDPASAVKCVTSWPYDRLSQSLSCPPTRWIIASAGGRLYGACEGRPDQDGRATSLIAVFDRSGKALAWNITPQPPADDPALHKVTAQGVASKRFSYSHPFGLGRSAIYVRSSSHIWCFGTP